MPRSICLNEDQVERIVERDTNNIDKAFMSGAITQEQYDAEIAELDAWANRQYKTLDRVYGEA